MAAARCGSLSRSFISSARASSLRSPPPAPRLRRPPAASPRLHRRLVSFAPPSNLGELRSIQSFQLFNSASVAALPRLTAHPSAQMRAFCELSHGTFRRTCQDR